MSSSYIKVASFFSYYIFFTSLFFSTSVNAQVDRWNHVENKTTSVAIGDHGSGVMLGHQWSSNMTKAKYFSSYDQGIATVIWSRDIMIPQPPSGTATFSGGKVAAAKKADLYAYAHIEKIAEGQYPLNYRAVVNVFKSNSSVPVWTFKTSPNEYIENNSNRISIAVAPDGSKVILSYVRLHPTGRIRAIVLNGVTGSVIRDAVHEGSPYVFSVSKMSADGKYVLFGYATYVKLFNVETGLFSNIQLNPPPTGACTQSITLMNGYGISEDGSRLAFIGSGTGANALNITMKIFDRQLDGTFQMSHCEMMGNIGMTPTLVDLSNDGQLFTVSFRIGDTTTMTALRLITYDLSNLPALSILSNILFNANGPKQATPSGLKISENGEVVVLSTLGDAGSGIPQLVMARVDQNVPYFTYNSPGSIIDMDLSADRKFVVVSETPQHASNTTSTGARIKTFSAIPFGVDIVGLPRIGNTITVKVNLPVGLVPNRVFLMSNGFLQEPPHVFDFGTLFLRLLGLKVSPLSQSGGNYQKNITLTGTNYQLGTKTFYQGYYAADDTRYLTDDFSAIRVLP